MRSFPCLIFALAALAAQAQVPEPKVQRPAPEQPLPFSHKTHAAASLACKQCHAMPEPGDFATLPATKVCMSCHIAIKKDSPHIAKLTAFHNGNQKIPWARVYRIPDYVFFNHQVHISVKDVNCETCHGPVATRDSLHRERELTMQTCMDCHRLKQAKNECTFCHDQR